MFRDATDTKPVINPRFTAPAQGLAPRLPGPNVPLSPLVHGYPNVPQLGRDLVGEAEFNLRQPIVPPAALNQMQQPQQFVGGGGVGGIPDFYGPAQAAMGEMRRSAKQLAGMGEQIDRAEAEERAAIDEQSALIEKQVREQEAFYAIQGQKMGEAVADFRAASDRLAALQVKPDRLFKNTGFTTAAAISMALGGLAEGISGGTIKSNALQMINGALDRDLQAQEAEYRRLQDDKAGKYTLIGMLRDMGNDEQAAMGVARQLGLQAAQSKIQKAMLASKSIAQKAELTKLNADLQNQIAGVALNLADGKTRVEMAKLQARAAAAQQQRELTEKQQEQELAFGTRQETYNRVISAADRLGVGRFRGLAIEKMPRDFFSTLGFEDAAEFKEASTAMYQATLNAAKGTQSDQDARILRMAIPTLSSGAADYGASLRTMAAVDRLVQRKARLLRGDARLALQFEKEKNGYTKAAMAAKTPELRARIMEDAERALESKWGNL